MSWPLEREHLAETSDIPTTSRSSGQSMYYNIISVLNHHSMLQYAQKTYISVDSLMTEGGAVNINPLPNHTHIMLLISSKCKLYLRVFYNLGYGNTFQNNDNIFQAY